VSVLLLDDTLKPASTVANGAINEYVETKVEPLILIVTKFFLNKQYFQKISNANDVSDYVTKHRQNNK